MTVCAKCGKGIPGDGVCITGEVYGDEYSDCWYFCESCSVYTLNAFYEPFMGDGETEVRGPFPKEQGDYKISVIRKCASPHDDRCECPAHKEYFGV
jgi:hypothetical protein